jgi:hypothetical protein
MKSLMSLVLGVALAVVLFAGGVAASSWILQDPAAHRFAHLEEQPLWTNAPVPVDPKEQSFERVAAAPIPPVFQAMAVVVTEDRGRGQIETASAQGAGRELDMTATAVLEDNPMIDLAGSPHAAWCAERYRSYRIEDNSYQPYGNSRRQCDSPYLAAQETAAYSSVVEQNSLGADDAHASWCFDRYRSYEPSTNTYQPFGAPRRACESPFG